MKIFYKAMLIVVAFLVFVCLLYLGFGKYIKKPTQKRDYYTEKLTELREAEHRREERAINLVKDRHWDGMKLVMEDLKGYVKHIEWEAFKGPRGSDYYEREIQYPLQESTYLVSYSYTTPELMKQDLVRGWWWEVVLGENTVRLIDYDQYRKEKNLADSIGQTIERKKAILARQLEIIKRLESDTNPGQAFIDSAQAFWDSVQAFIEMDPLLKEKKALADSIQRVVRPKIDLSTFDKSKKDTSK